MCYLSMIYYQVWCNSLEKKNDFGVALQSMISSIEFELELNGKQNMQ